MNIFEQLDKILNSINEAEEVETAKEKAEKIVKSIPISPEMETEAQGRQKAMEQIAKYFYDLSMGSPFGGMGLQKKDDISLPDDWIDPHFKGEMKGKMEDHTFEKNKLIWDEDEEMEKLEKDVELHMDSSEDEFDDFDYRDNDFGDDADMDDVDMDDMEGGGGSGDDSDKSEDEKLRDDIDDALDQLSDSGDLDGDSGSQDGSQGGQQQGGQQSGQQQGGSQQGGQQQGGQQGGQEGGQGSDSQDNGSGSSYSKSGVTTKKDQKLKELKDSIDKGDLGGVSKSVEDIKEGEDGSGELAGQNIGEVSDKVLKSDMEKAGVSENDIKDMSKMAKDDKLKELGDDKLTDMRKQIIDGLEKNCESKGGSALARTIVKNSLKSKVNDDEWRAMLKLFLKSKATNSGDMSKAKNGIKFGHKNHLWRDAMLPTKATSRGNIQTIYCFVDFSGSVNQDLVYVFLGRVIDLCAELSYTDVVVYGFGTNIVLPRKIDGRMLKLKGKDVVLSQTWDYIQQQNPGASTENFRDVANEIMEIRKKQRDAVYLIFGDALWGDTNNGPACLKYICGERLLDRIYYTDDNVKSYQGYLAMLTDIVGLKHVISTKAKHIRE